MSTTTKSSLQLVELEQAQISLESRLYSAADGPHLRTLQRRLSLPSLGMFVKYDVNAVKPATVANLILT